MRFVGLTEFLHMLEERHAVRLHRSNLSARRESAGVGAESILERLEREGLARSEAHGTRRRWQIAVEALPILADQARSARPGPQPGAQRTLTALELERFVRWLATVERPADHVQEALRHATRQKAEGVERVVIPVHPRRSPSE